MTCYPGISMVLHSRQYVWFVWREGYVLCNPFLWMSIYRKEMKWNSRKQKKENKKERNSYVTCVCICLFLIFTLIHVSNVNKHKLFSVMFIFTSWKLIMLSNGQSSLDYLVDHLNCVRLQLWWPALFQRPHPRLP